MKASAASLSRIPAVRAIQLSLAVVLGFVAVVEMSHFRFYQKRGNVARMIFTGVATAGPLYMASECLTGDWPAWESP